MHQGLHVETVNKTQPTQTLKKRKTVKTRDITLVKNYELHHRIHSVIRKDRRFPNLMKTLGT